MNIKLKGNYVNLNFDTEKAKLVSLIKTIQLMIYTHWYSLRNKLGYYLYLLAIHVIPEGKARINFYHDLLFSPASVYKQCDACYQISKEEYENIKLQNWIDIEEVIKVELGEGLIKYLFDNDYIHISRRDEPDGNITFKAELFASMFPIDPRIFSMFKSFDNIELVGWAPETKQE